MADADAQQQDAPPERECVVRHTRGVSNAKIYAAPFEASLNETMATYPADLMDSPVHVTQQRAVLKTLATSFQRENKAIFEEERSFASQMCKSSRDKAKKREFGVHQAALPHYFYSKIRGIEDTRWKLFFTQRILVFHNHFCVGGSKSMSLDGTLATSLHDASFNKSDFNALQLLFALPNNQG
jgi:hypothetical protein